MILQYRKVMTNPDQEVQERVNIASIPVCCEVMVSRVEHQPCSRCISAVVSQEMIVNHWHILVLSITVLATASNSAVCGQDVQNVDVLHTSQKSFYWDAKEL